MNEQLTEWGTALFAIGFMIVCFVPTAGARTAPSGSALCGAAPAGARAWASTAGFAAGSAMWIGGAVLLAAGLNRPFVGAALVGAWVAGTALRIRKRQLEGGGSARESFLCAPMAMVLAAASLMIASPFASGILSGAGAPSVGGALAASGALLALWMVAAGHHAYYLKRSGGEPITLLRAFNGTPIGVLVVTAGAMFTLGILLLLPAL